MMNRKSRDKNTKSKYLQRFLLIIPTIGMALFLFFYSLAAINYPGGSWNVPNKTGFSFWNNYLCDLLDTYAINGELNSARYYARISLGVLCGSLLILWNKLPFFFSTKSRNKTIMGVSGNLALGITLFLTSGTHDITIRIAGVFGVIAFISCFIELLKEKMFYLFNFGLVCLFVFLANYFIYETELFIHSLPIIQKVTFFLCIVWFFFLNIAIYRKLINSKK
tara:strand:+ start:81760 stop:82425 length:666 start_codon:yes stop_codon:yes gene_type:complete